MYFYIKKEYFFNHYDQVYLEMVETSGVHWVFHDKEMIIGSFHSLRSAQFFIMMMMMVMVMVTFNPVKYLIDDEKKIIISYCYDVCYI